MFEPYFSVEQTEEQNLGALGTIIGHEITHAFDDLGHLYDANGDYRNWWTKADETAFGQRAQAIVAYYSAYKDARRDAAGRYVYFGRKYR